MAVSKRLRYEVLRRDNHSCRYCGARAPEVHLTVDHVLPKALGGSDEAGNLVAACRGCNAGKSASSPDAGLVEDVQQDAIRWAQAREIAAANHRARLEERDEKIVTLVQYWDNAFASEHGWIPDVAEDLDSSVGYWLDHGLTLLDMFYLIDSAVVPRVGKKVSQENAFSYFAGCCWTRLRQIEAEAQAIIDQGGV